LGTIHINFYEIINAWRLAEMYYFRAVTVNPKVPERIGRLQELAYNLWFSWNPLAMDLFKRVNGELWEEVYHSSLKIQFYP